MADFTVSQAEAERLQLQRAVWSARLTRLLWWLAVLAVFVGSLISLMPIYWMITGSFKIQHDAIAYPPELFPAHPTLKNWEKLLVGMPTLRWLLNSFIAASGVALLGVITSTLAGYAFGKKRFPGQNFLFWLLLLTMMLPKQISLIPLFIMMRDLKWFDTYFALIIPYAAYPFGIFLVKQFMQGIPSDLLDAAKIDGASEFGVFWHVVLPLTKPAVGALAIFAFMFGWNDYIWQLVVTNKQTMLTLPVGVSKLVAGWATIDIGVGMAGATLAFIPMLVIFLLFQDYFVKGITVGAVKG
ncbi:MAG: carbohydrate ABC transporter permease [Anaerolineae bacterium]